MAPKLFFLFATAERLQEYKTGARTNGDTPWPDMESATVAIALVGYAVAVGTAIADRPPHRSVRAVLSHTAPA
jgi:hypothetical protein